MLSCAQGAGRAVICAAVMPAPEWGMKGAYMTRVGYPRGRRGGGTGRVALGGRPRRMCPLLVARGEP